MIGIFDSGIGGLTVVKELCKVLPGYQLLYFGDTARTPYGNKSEETIVQYALQDTDFLLQRGAHIIVIACNTASAVAADELRRRYPNIPIFEVIDPAVIQAVRVTKNKRIGVIGTRATVGSHIYEKKITAFKNGYTIISKPCPLFVPLAEENWIQEPVTKMIARKYLYSLRLQQIDTLILGCTHYPLLRSVIQQKIGKRVALVDPAEQTALLLKRYLREHSEINSALQKNLHHEFFFSDQAPHLAELAGRWLGQKITPQLHRIG